MGTDTLNFFFIVLGGLVALAAILDLTAYWMTKQCLRDQELRQIRECERMSEFWRGQ